MSRRKESYISSYIDREYKTKLKYEKKKETNKKQYGGKNNENGCVFK